MKNRWDIFKKNLSKNLKPKTSWWSLVGIIFFFFVPEVVAYFWGDSIIVYFNMMQRGTDDYMKQKLYETLKTFGENSLVNIVVGLGLVGWFFYERRRDEK